MKNKNNKKRNIVNFRTKAEVILIVLLFVGIAMRSNIQSTVTMTDKTTTTDDSGLIINWEEGWMNMWNATIDNESINKSRISGWDASNVTLIRNSNDNSWIATGANIQLAIYDLNSSGGGKVTLPEGTSTLPNLGENLSTLYITDNVWLCGQGNSTIIKLADSADSKVVVNQDETNGNVGIKISDLQINGNGINQDSSNWNRDHNGITLVRCHNSVIENVRVANASAYGIQIRRGGENSIINCEVYNAGAGRPYNMFDDDTNLGHYCIGITVKSEKFTKIIGCRVHDCLSNGIVVEHMYDGIPNNGNIVSGNIIWDCYAGIWFENAENSTIHGNIIYNNTKRGAYEDSIPTGMVIGSNSKNLVISNNHLNYNGWSSSSCSISIHHTSSNIIITGNYINNSYGYGISGAGNYSKISDNRIGNSNNSGIYITDFFGTTGFSITDNTITNSTNRGIIASSGIPSISSIIISDNIINHTTNDEGIKSVFYHNVITGNSIFNSAADGILCTGGDKNIISNNDVFNSGASGIRVLNSDNGTMMGNFVDTATDGIQLQASYNYTVMGNNLKGCTDDGIDESGDYNTIVGNNVLGNTNALEVISPDGAHSIIKDNPGYTTESSGLCTISSGDNSVTVNHNMSIKPTIVTFGSRDNLTAAGVSNPYVDTFTATQFTLHVNNTTTGAVSFWWKAEY